MEYKNIEDTAKIVEAREHHDKAESFWHKIAGMFRRDEASKAEYDAAFREERKAFKELEETKNK